MLTAIKTNDWIEIAYTLVIAISCTYIFLKTRKIYKLSSHPGIKVFRDAFFYFGIAFMVRYIGIALPIFIGSADMVFPYFLAQLLLNYLLCMGNLSLVYSLIWKDFEKNRIYVLNLAAIAIAIADAFYTPFVISIICQIAVLLYGLTISYSNYNLSKKKNQAKFSQFYMISLILAIIGYVINLISKLIIAFLPFFYIYAYLVTASVFIIFLIGVKKVLK
jgi:hypothetical protein